MLTLKASHLVYRNPKPHLRAVHAWHPSIVRLPDGELIASFDLAQAVESLDYRTYTARSGDGGATWSAPAPLLEGEAHPRRSTHTVRISRMGDGTLVGAGARFFRDDPEEGLTNRDNLGFVEMEVFLVRSGDDGRTWGRPELLAPPLEGPGFEVCHSIVELSDGWWVLPTSTWRGWEGYCPNGMKAVMLVSRDKGKTWPEYVDLFDQWDRQIISWEVSVVELPDRRLLAVVWSYDLQAGVSRPTRYTLSEDGRSFGPARETGLQGETAKLLSLGDGRVVCLYRNQEAPGLWGAVARIEGERWVTLERQPLWQGSASKMRGQAAGSDELGALKFGFPSMTRLPDGDVLALFWCQEEGIHNIRALRLGVGKA